MPVMSDAQKAMLNSNLDSTRAQIKEYHDEGKAAIVQASDASAISDLLAKGPSMGWGAQWRQNGARILQSLGVNPDAVQSFLTNPNTGDELNKMFLKFSADAVRQMGAREPGSVISLFAKAFPNLETMPEAAELMNNALRMQAQWKTDRANAAEQWALQQQKGMGPTGENYQGMLGFEKQFGQTNNPRDYWLAAQAMSHNQANVWSGLSAEQKAHVLSLIPDDASVYGPDGNGRPATALKNAVAKGASL
jgi:hypothetical protein